MSIQTAKKNNNLSHFVHKKTIYILRQFKKKISCKSCLIHPSYPLLCIFVLKILVTLVNPQKQTTQTHYLYIQQFSFLAKTLTMINRSCETKMMIQKGYVSY